MTPKEKKLIAKAISWERRWDRGPVKVGSSDRAHLLSLAVQAVMRERGLKGGNVL